MSDYFTQCNPKCLALVLLRSTIKPLLEVHLKARKLFFFEAVNVGEVARTAHIADFGRPQTPQEFFPPPLRDGLAMAKAAPAARLPTRAVCHALLKLRRP